MDNYKDYKYNKNRGSGFLNAIANLIINVFRGFLWLVKNIVKVGLLILLLMLGWGFIKGW